MTSQQPVADDSSPRTQEEFWKIYLHEHQNPANRWLHVLGTVGSWVLLAVTLSLQLWWLLILVPVVGYGFAWIGHVFLEGNKLVSIRYPVRSLLADYLLTFLMLGKFIGVRRI